MVKYTITVEKQLWERFKRRVSKDRTLNDAIVQLIENFCAEGS